MRQHEAYTQPSKLAATQDNNNRWSGAGPRKGAKGVAAAAAAAAADAARVPLPQIRRPSSSDTGRLFFPPPHYAAAAAMLFLPPRALDYWGIFRRGRLRALVVHCSVRGEDVII